MSKLSSEKVLCSATADLPPSWLPEMGFVSLTQKELLRGLDEVAPHWLPRGEAEQNPAFKQWIPYVLLRNDRGELAAYPRQGSEARLHGFWSLGIGGHINAQDGYESEGQGWRAFIWNGLRRELAEEFPGAVEGESRFLGLIHESRSPVGCVHIGAVFLHQPRSISDLPTSELAGLQWLPPETIGTSAWPWDCFEQWSRLALELFLHRLG